jgi:hypothetical protein
MIRDATPSDIEHFWTDVPRETIRLCYGRAVWFRAIEACGMTMLLYGSDGQYLCIFPSTFIWSAPIAFGRATRKAAAELKGSHLLVKWPCDEPKVCSWAEWLGIHPLANGWVVL